MRPVRCPLCLLGCLALAGCGSGDGAGAADAGAGAADAGDPLEPAEDWSRDILSTSLRVDLERREGTAVIELAPSESTAASFEVGDLEILAVERAGAELPYEVSGERLDVGVPEGGGSPVELSVSYRYQPHDAFDGASESGYTLIWPYYCGNLFPCKSDPEDGLAFELELSGAGGETAVYPEAIPEDAPSYMIAWAVGDYTYVDLGTTAAGTEIGAYHLPGEAEETAEGTADLRDVFDWLEANLGPYPFGGAAASVSVGWGPGAFGGMEHHPLWHVGSAAMGDDLTHAHEAAHGWFGNGVRIACWEDFVLSEGTVSYLAARALGEVAGAARRDEIWSRYQQRLDALQSSSRNKIARPAGCNELDILEDGLFGTAPYMKGAFFFRALAERVGAADLDAALAAFFADRAGEAARMQDLLDRIESETGYDPSACAEDWLRSESVPTDAACP